MEARTATETIVISQARVMPLRARMMMVEFVKRVWVLDVF